MEQCLLARRLPTHSPLLGFTDQTTSGKTCGLSPETVKPQVNGPNLLVRKSQHSPPDTNRGAQLCRARKNKEGKRTHRASNRRSKTLSDAALLLSRPFSPPSNRKPKLSLCNRSAVPTVGCPRAAVRVALCVERTLRNLCEDPRRHSSPRPARLARHAPLALPSRSDAPCTPSRAVQETSDQPNGRETAPTAVS